MSRVQDFLQLHLWMSGNSVEIWSISFILGVWMQRNSIRFSKLICAFGSWISLGGDQGPTWDQYMHPTDGCCTEDLCHQPVIWILILHTLKIRNFRFVTYMSVAWWLIDVGDMVWEEEISPNNGKMCGSCRSDLYCTSESPVHSLHCSRSMGSARLWSLHFAFKLW